jgi:hypothetical protein
VCWKRGEGGGGGVVVQYKMSRESEMLKTVDSFKLVSEEVLLVIGLFCEVNKHTTVTN